MKQQAQGKPGKKRTNAPRRNPAQAEQAGPRSRTTAASAPVLQNGAPAWLNWAAVTLAVVIVAGVFLLSARQLSAPQNGVSADQANLLQSGVGGMRLDTDGTAVPETAADSAGQATAETNGISAAAGGSETTLAVGAMLVNPDARVPLYADASENAAFLDSYATGGTFEIMEPSGDFYEYPVVAGGQEWVRVRAADGLVGWTPAETLHPAP